MGEVYRARDSRLERTVAIKILSQLSNDPARKQRFEREAKAISSLNHPNICTLHDIGHEDGIHYMVMECIEGETLAKRLEKGPLPIDQVLKVGMQISDALDKAHRAGIVHRDLKPSNIMLTSTGAKLMDFGLAKPASALVDAATITATKAERPVTEQGTIVGTFQYMSPEQIEGRDIDGRSDIFSFGAVLYEILTGRRAFEAKNRLSVASAILEKEPAPITTLKPLTPPALDHAIRACLAKDPDERWQSARDLAKELRWIGEAGSLARAGEMPRPTFRMWQLAGWAISALLLVLLGAALWRERMQERKSAMYFNSPVRFAASSVALSPDGNTLAMVAYDEQANKYMIRIQQVGSRNVTNVPGTVGASYPFWSPDGQSIGFFAEGKLKKVDAFSGREAQTLCEAPNGRGGTWNREGVILFSPNGFGGLYRISSVGGTPTEVTKVDASQYSHRWPKFLPDGRHFLYLGANFSGRPENHVFVGSLDSTERRSLVDASSNAAYAEPGYLFYIRDNSLVAQRFDAKTLKLNGEASPISGDVNYSPMMDLAIFDVAAAGKTLVVQTGKGASQSQLTWYDRSGRSGGVVGPSAAILNPSLSPDGRRVVFTEIDQDGGVNIWINELSNGATTRLTFGRATDQIPTWSPDGKWVAFSTNQKVVRETLYKKNSNGSGTAQEIADLGAEAQAAWDWSRDGKYLLTMKNRELWYLATSDWQAKPFLQVKGTIRNAQFSPDGKWVACSSNESGLWQVYVSPFPSANGKWQISTEDGDEPRWRRDGKELFFLSGGHNLMAVPVKTGNTFEAGPAVSLFQTHPRQRITFLDAFFYDVSVDGQKFLINTPLEEGGSAPLSFILNWASELER
jgi:Tol biopolymer transport system component